MSTVIRYYNDGELKKPLVDGLLTPTIKGNGGMSGRIEVAEGH